MMIDGKFCLSMEDIKNAPVSFVRDCGNDIVVFQDECNELFAARRVRRNHQVFYRILSISVDK